METYMRRMKHNLSPTRLPYMKYNSCERKRAYKNEAKALSVIENMQKTKADRKPNRPLEAYHCMFCLEWHVGHGRNKDDGIKSNPGEE